MEVAHNDVRAAFIRQADAADRGANTEAGIWVLTLMVGVAAFIWAVLGGGDALTRLAVLARFWPMVAVWSLALAWRARGIARARTEIARAGVMLAMGDRPQGI
jgi:hypothetical protein